MKIESPEFTAETVEAFLLEQVEREREHLARRLEAVGERLAEIAPRLRRLPEPADSSDPAWNARETLGHMALVSKLYGVLAYRTAKGDTDLDLLELVRQRDVFGREAARQPVDEHLGAMGADHRRSVEFLRGASWQDLQRVAEVGIDGLRMTAFDIFRLPLVNHLESHLEQLEAALG